ncbi:act minimal PKS chain-length factor (CLF/KS beta) [Nocardiopsis arvandica]|uniref:Act minimal PKS chain-length factor (CLF/KS beta) n=1 Tax=Nocardiopsis sinuspersici TaxID=501010 RepID=A0A7Z0BNJ7_9ACTN|nr:ketosynthase chain-length factor [Nocardiopsis sinuspersici]NYH55652.1 act minimal PKS chain-length factor (CLF/KS beta) [Nocardiopsis sinuspersici]
MVVRTPTTGAAGTAEETPGTAAPVVTGIGVAAPNGLGTGPWWRATLAGERAIAPVSRFDVGRYPAHLAGEVHGFDPDEHLPNRLIPQTDHMTRLALAAAEEAFADAGLDTSALPEYAAGVVTSASAGGFEFGQKELQALWSKGPRHVSAYQSFAWFYAVNTGQISIRHGLRGPSGVVVSGEAGGLDAVAQARRRLRGDADHMLTGGVDGSLCPWGWTALLSSGRLSTSDDPERAYLPFGADARGHVVGEGGALLVLEDPGTARARGARAYGALTGYAATFDPAPGTGGEPGLRHAIEQALDEAGVEPDQVGVVFADACGVPEADRAEADAITRVFGPEGVPVTAPKTLTGRLCAGGASLDLAAALLSVHEGVVPPTADVGRQAEGISLDLVVEGPRYGRVDTALVLARGQGGFNAAAVVRAAHG